MNILNRDELQIIISFLSLENKLNLAITCKSLKSLIRKQDIALFSIEKKVNNFFSPVIKSGLELILAVNNNFILYIDESFITPQTRVHPLFRIKNTNKNCVNVSCRDKMLEYIYISQHRGNIPRYLHSMYYIKRKIPYCMSCFNKWGVDAYLNHPQSKEKILL